MRVNIENNYKIIYCSECMKNKSIEEIGAKLTFEKIQQNETMIDHQKEREIYFICNKCLIKNTNVCEGNTKK